MYVYLQAYEPAAAAVQPLVAFVTFYRGQTKAFETAAAAGDRGHEQPAQDRAAALQPGAVETAARPVRCQVTVLDPATQKAAFWQAPVMLVP